MLFGNKFLAASGIYFMASMLPKLTAMVLLPVRTHYLSPAEFGVLGTLASIGGFMTPLLLLGTTGAIVRAYYEHQQETGGFPSYLMSTWLGVGIFSLFVVVLAEAAGSLLWECTPVSEKIPFHPYVSLTLLKVLMGVLGTSFLLPVFRAMQKPWWFAAVSVGGWGLLLAAGLYGLVTNGLEGQIIAEIPASIIMGVVSVVLLWRLFRPDRLRWGYLKAALAFGLPLVPHMLSIWVMNLSDRVLLASMVPMEDVGLYNLAMSLAIMMVFVISSLNEAWVPRYYQLMAQEDRNLDEVRQYSALWILGVGACCVGMMLFATDVIDFLTTKDYASSSRFVPIMAFSFLVMGIYHFGVNPLFYHKKTKYIPWVSGGAAALNVMLNLLLIPRLGAVGAAVSTLLAQSMMAIIFHGITREIDPMPYPYLAGLLPVATVGGMAVWLSFWQEPAGLSFLLRVGIAMLALLLFVPLLPISLKRKLV